jgi:ribose 5-phosphate isomerase A
VPFAREDTLRRLARHASEVVLRMRDGEPYLTDEGMNIADLHCGRIEDPEALLAAIKLEPGVLDAGLFVGIATCVVYGHDDGRIERLDR